MNAIEDRLLAHARVVRTRGLAMPMDGLPSADILDSWVRCTDAGMDPHQATPMTILSAGELRERREQSDYLRRLALGELETLHHQISGSNFLLAFADRDGVILDRYADNRFATSHSGEDIVAGSRWTEALSGTNGLGTALAVGRSMMVSGTEHFFLSLGQIACTAAPVRDAYGEVVGALDASSYVESRQHHTQALVQMAASHLENRLLVHQMQGETVLAIHPRAEFLGTLSAGLLAFGATGRLLAVNAQAHTLLSGLTLDSHTVFEELFAEPLEHALSRLRCREEVRLRDALGSMLITRLVGRSTISSSRQTPNRDARHVALLHQDSEPQQPKDQAPSAPASHSKAVDSSDWLADDLRVRQAAELATSALRLGAHVLIGGETGSGKDMLARHAHAASGRSGAFVALNCAALPTELFEAELFGHASGAFTGARKEGHVGLLVSADGGTLLLDEIADLPPRMQASLLRFLDDQIVRPIGSVQGRRVDVQILAACHADLQEEVRQHRFRADLYYRLSAVKVSLPPLREREDFDAAVLYLLRQIDPTVTVSPEALTRLRSHAWPGNFRELRNVLTRAVLLASHMAKPTVLNSTMFGDCLPEATMHRAPGASSASHAKTGQDATDSTLHSSLQQSATRMVMRAFEQSGGSISRTSRELGISRTTVYRHLRAAGLRAPTTVNA